MGKIVFVTFTTPKGFYLYDRNMNSLLRISKYEYDGINGKDIHIRDAIIKDLQEKGFCKEGRLEKIEHPDLKYLKYHLDSNIQQITLQVTQNCNLRCGYCAYSGNYEQRVHNNKTMDFETAKKCIDYGMKHSANTDMISIAFYGGEPLLQIELIKKCIEYINANYPEKEIMYTTTTNGTLLTEDIVNYFESIDFNVNISLDGPQDIHDKQRKFADGRGSFQLIFKNLQNIKENHPEFYKKVTFNTVISPTSDLKCVKDFFKAETVLEDRIIRKNTVSNLGSTTPIVYNDYYYITYRYEFMKVLLNLIGEIDNSLISPLFSNEISQYKTFYERLSTRSELPEVAHHGGPCVPGARRLFINVEGDMYPCERVSETSDAMKIGHIDTGIDTDKASELINIGNLTKDECLSCWNLLYCGMCAAFADMNGKLEKSQKLSYCNAMKEDTIFKMSTLCMLREFGIQPEEALNDEKVSSISV
ncbi:MAG: Cys-rich peptide radical maturase CcpM [Herbinix sp.]|jgi:uncharacterized protein|nr:Cys-rich peptide radical maturase CcpM [Herbinix sp.]